jgi:hypothetical protein
MGNEKPRFLIHLNKAFWLLGFFHSFFFWWKGGGKSSKTGPPGLWEKCTGVKEKTKTIRVRESYKKGEISSRRF